ncbi:armadillo-type protein [Mycena sp. CBHHK59/15]|nr:armadillo-type protein [Mycena sp. CBHHK59/15]
MSTLPSLAAADVDHAIHLIQSAYAPTADLAGLQALQAALVAMQRTPAAWGLVAPLLGHADANVQFFGAHTAALKAAAGDLRQLPVGVRSALRGVLLAAVGVGDRPRVVRRKLYAAVAALAIRLAAGGREGDGDGEEQEDVRWDAWLVDTAGAIQEPEHAHEFLAVAAEDVAAASLLPVSRAPLTATLRAAGPAVLASIAHTPASPAALRCLAAWLPSGALPPADLAALVPALISLLMPLSPLLGWVAGAFPFASSATPSAAWDSAATPSFDVPSAHGRADAAALAPHVKLLVALGEHAVEWVAAHLVDPSVVFPPPALTTSSNGGYGGPQHTRAHLAHTFLRVMLALTAADPGGAPVEGSWGDDDEDDEEQGWDASDTGAPLGFWYLLQEALWEPHEVIDDVDEEVAAALETPAGRARTKAAQAAYVALVRVLRGKVVFPPAGAGWSKDRLERFVVSSLLLFLSCSKIRMLTRLFLARYRRDVGDTLVNAYYILRDDLLAFYVGDVEQRLTAGVGGGGWEEIEATLHCILSIHEALDLQHAASSPHLTRLFEPALLARLPDASAGASPGVQRVRRTALGVVGTYASWLATQPADAVLPALGYAVGALADADGALCLQAALALRSLCDANRRALAGRVDAFAEVHAGLDRVPDSEKGKVLQSIASVIQALPPAEEVAPIEAMVNPILHRLAAALASAGTLPEDARVACILQLEILAGIARGLTRTTDPLLSLDDGADGSEAELVREARAHPRTVALREALFEAIQRIADLWSEDAEVGQALSELFKAITSLSADTTILTLPAAPLLALVCRAARRRLTAVWLTLATTLVAQLNPPSFLLTLKTSPTPDAEAAVRAALAEIVHATLAVLGAPGGMTENPDIVQEFFSCMDRVAQDFTSAFYTLPDSTLDALMQCTVSALALQERYSLVAACTFLGCLIHRTSLYDELAAQRQHLVQLHGRAIMRAVLCGFAGVAPRTTGPNLIELLSALLTRFPNECRVWIPEILYADDFVPSKAGPEVKDRFIKSVVGSRSIKRTKEAAHQFTLVAWGLEGSSFGYSSAM